MNATKSPLSPVFLDHASTSHPKPPQVLEQMCRYARDVGIGNDRGGYREGVLVAQMLAGLRCTLAGLINAPLDYPVGGSRDCSDIVFTSGATEALNMIILGSLRPGDHVITSPFEHNAVRRPLNHLMAKSGVEVSMIPGSVRGGLDLAAMKEALRPSTRMCLINHVSNAFGVVAPIAEIGRILRQYDERILFVVDAAQSMGSLDLDVQSVGIDALVFAGHKGLLGPPGTGGFYMDPAMVPLVEPRKFGGTGSRSVHGVFVDEMPTRFEVGTMNTWGLAGLAAGVDAVLEEGVSAVGERIGRLVKRTVEGLRRCNRVKLHVPEGAGVSPHGMVSFSMPPLSPRDISSLLESKFSIKVREGLHCAPWAHQCAGTAPHGTVRASFGYSTTIEEVDRLLEGVEAIGGGCGRRKRGDIGTQSGRGHGENIATSATADTVSGADTATGQAELDTTIEKGQVGP